MLTYKFLYSTVRVRGIVSVSIGVSISVVQLVLLNVLRVINLGLMSDGAAYPSTGMENNTKHIHEVPIIPYRPLLWICSSQ